MPCNPDPTNVTQATKEVYTRWKLFKEQQRRAHRYAAAEGSDNDEKSATESDARDEDGKEEGTDSVDADGHAEGGRKRQLDGSTSGASEGPLVLKGDGADKVSVRFVVNCNSNCWWNSMIPVFVSILQANLLPKENEEVTEPARKYFAVIREVAKGMHERMSASIKVCEPFPHQSSYGTIPVESTLVP